MGARTRRVFGEALKFSAVNVVATAVAVLLFNALVHGLPGLYGPGPLHGYPVMTYFFANTVGMLISFYGSRSYAFKHRVPTGPGGGLLNYAIVNFTSFAIPMSCLWVTRNVFGWSSVLADNVSANMVGAVLAMLFRFWAFRRFVFKRLPFASVGPELGPHEAELLEHQPQQGQADPHDVVGVAGQARHEGPAAPVDGEGAGDR
jgi:putative flippase GtrA